MDSISFMKPMTTLFKRLKKINRLKETQLLIASTILCFTFSIFRIKLTQSGTYFFLNWNLFLAFIPWLLSTLFLMYPSIQIKKTSTALIMLSWLLFFPNAPYILTDLFHMRYIDTMPVWFDLTFILLFAWTGLLYGFLSLRNVEEIMTIKYSKKIAKISSITMLYVAAFGVYLGRFLRWNSWDILQEPMGLIYDVAHRFVYPFEHPRTWGMTLFFGLFLNVVYWSLKFVHSEKAVKGE